MTGEALKNENIFFAVTFFLRSKQYRPENRGLLE